jgi:hypothetical protein
VSKTTMAMLFIEIFGLEIIGIYGCCGRGLQRRI